MYVNPFLLGVLVTVGAEIVAFAVACVIVALKQNKKR